MASAHPEYSEFQNRKLVTWNIFFSFSDVLLLPLKKSKVIFRFCGNKQAQW